ncbi:Zn(II)2Cys6 transcription factor domain-containing protein [bacterium]|nr:Zn(II)2Cys6 transcription factor domain-containing protein [bacterium]
MSSKMSACTECRAKRKKCDCREGVFPCSRCVRNGRTCVQPQDAGAAGAASVGPQHKRKKPDTPPPSQDMHTGDPFFSALADGWVIAALARLDPAHHGLRCILQAMFTHAFQSGSVALVQRAARFVQILGVNLHDLTGIQHHALNISVKTTYDTFSAKAMQHHDFALGREHTPWTPASVGGRVIFMCTGVRTANPQMLVTPHFEELFGPNKLQTIIHDRTPVFTLVSQVTTPPHVQRMVQAYMYLVEQYTTPDSGPLTINIPGITIKTLSGECSADVFLTLYLPGVGNHSILEIVQEQSTVASHAAASIDQIPGEDMAAARSLANLM